MTPTAAELREQIEAARKRRSSLAARLKAVKEWIENAVRRLRRKRRRRGYRVIPRSEWGARTPRSVTALSSTSNGIFVHHTVGPAPTTESSEKAEMRNIQNYHMDSHGWSDIAYSFVVFPSGRIYEARGKGRAGAHTEGYNSTSYAICGAGNYEVSAPSDTMIAAMRWLRREYLGLGAAKLRGHRDVNSTACPGAKLYARLREL